MQFLTFIQIKIIKKKNQSERSEDCGPLPEPVVEEPIVEEPIVEEPIVEEPIVEEPIVEEPIVEELPKTEEGGGGCLIATATYGTELAPQVQQLRELRDNSLLQTASGSTFMIGFNQLYYSFSPSIADFERENPVFREAVKLAITPLLTSLSILNHLDVDSESEVLGYGVGVILLNIGMYFVGPAVLIQKLRKKF